MDIAQSLSRPASTVIDRIRYLIETRRLTQTEFARLIGVYPTNVSKVLTGKLGVSEGMLNRIVVNMGVSKAWLRDGEGVPFEKTENTRQMHGYDISSATRNDNGIPVYDIDVTAGCRELSSMFTEDNIIGHVSLPIGPMEGSAIVRVSGDSMSPTIVNGGFVYIRPVSLASPIFWGQIYVVVLDDYRMVKYIRRDHSDPARIILHSDNPDYDDMEIAIADVRQLYLVEAVLNCNIRL